MILNINRKILILIEDPSRALVLIKTDLYYQETGSMMFRISTNSGIYPSSFTNVCK